MEQGKLISFDEHKFMIKTTSILAEGINRNENFLNHKTKQQYEYVKNVYKVLFKIRHTLETLQLSRIFIAERHPLSKKITGEMNSSITIDKYIRFHLECYFLRITTYKDLTLQLLNTVYQLNEKLGNGLESRLIKKSKGETKEKLMEIVERLNKLISTVQPKRNKVAHEGYYDNSDLSLLFGMLEFKRPMMEEHLKELIMENVAEMQGNEVEITSNLFYNLDRIYDDYYASISSYSNV